MNDKPFVRCYDRFWLSDPDDVIENPHLTVVIDTDDGPIPCINAWDALVHVISKMSELLALYQKSIRLHNDTIKDRNEERNFYKDLLEQHGLL